MIKIHLVGAHHSLNKGWAGIVVSTIEALRTEVPNVQFTLESSLPEMDSKAYGSVEVVKTILASKLRATFLLFRCILYALFRRIDLNASFLVSSRELKRYTDSNLVLNLGGDPLCQPFQTTGLTHALRRNIAAFAGSCYILLFGILLDRPVAIYAQSVGPFGTFEPLLRPILNRMTLITLREKRSMEYLQRMGIKSPTYLTADPAFLLKAEVRAKIPSKEKERIVGMSISHEAALHYYRSENTDFAKMMAMVVDYLAENLNATVIFVPQSIGPREFEDDREIVRKIYSLVKNKGKVRTVEGNYTPNELKGIIQRCKLFIGMRMHANIAAVSSYIPTIAIAHSYKTYGIMEMLGQEEWICDIRTLNHEILISKINKMLQRRNEIIASLRTKVKVAQELALLNAKLVKEIVVARTDQLALCSPTQISTKCPS